MTVLTAAAATAALTGTVAQQAAADPAAAPRDAAARVDALYQQAERATQAYDAAQERTRRLASDLTVLQERAARGRQRVNTLRDELGLLAAAQYRSGGLDPSLALLLSDDPAGYLDRAAVLSRLDSSQADRLRQLQDAQRALRAQSDQAAGELADLRRSQATLRARKLAVQHTLAAAQRLLDAMPPAQRAAYTPGATERTSRGRALPALPDLPDLPASSGRASVAVAAAEQMLGAPYVWGATGPNAFDCSGLMLYSYRRAGVALPRTSQEQMNAGQRVPLNRIRPGDLVVYRADASHIAMYVGGGRVIHAPYPGARVRYDPVGMMPITAVTRP